MAPVCNTIKAAKLISRFTQEARLGQRLEATQGFSGREAWNIAQRAFLASEAQHGKCPRMTWQQDAKWTKF
jgi:hypothetical protein